MSRTRLDRNNDFNEFYNSAKAVFEEFRNNDKGADKFERVYMLSICPGSRNGGNNPRVVEVFWGSRPFEGITLGRTWSAQTEYGATLSFTRDDNGFVIISLYPAYTDNRRPLETSITLSIWLDPKKLKDKYFLKRCWNYFMAYMEYTSLDGVPTFIQRFKIAYLRFFKHLIVDNKWQPTKFSVFGKDMIKFLLTVGLSGFIIYFVTITSSKDNENKLEIQLESTNKALNEIYRSVDSLKQSRSNVEKISKNIDSINFQINRALSGNTKK